MSSYRITQTEDINNVAQIEQHRILKKKGIKKQDQQKQFMEDMTKEMKWMKREGEVIIALGMNSPLLQKGVSKFIVDTELHNLQTPKLQEVKHFSSYFAAKELDSVSRNVGL